MSIQFATARLPIPVCRDRVGSGMRPALGQSVILTTIEVDSSDHAAWLAKVRLRMPHRGLVVRVYHHKDAEALF